MKAEINKLQLSASTDQQITAFSTKQSTNSNFPHEKISEQFRPVPTDEQTRELPHVPKNQLSETSI